MTITTRLLCAPQIAAAAAFILGGAMWEQRDWLVSSATWHGSATAFHPIHKLSIHASVNTVNGAFECWYTAAGAR